MEKTYPIIDKLKRLGLLNLENMYVPADKLFGFHIVGNQRGKKLEGLSCRYTAITLIGLAGEGREASRKVLGEIEPEEILQVLTAEASQKDNLGDVALVLWAACALGVEEKNLVWKRLLEMDPLQRPYPTVELAWALDGALTFGGRGTKLAFGLAERILASFNRETGLFPHMIGGGGGGRAHISCFADLVYPIHAFSRYYKATPKKEYLQAAARCAEQICRLQGPAGQWWWHYDYRTGKVIEPYPVYAIHQDAMAPMALRALREAGGPDYSENIQRGLDWLVSSPELAGGSLIDEADEMVWRKVARREPKKLVRYLNGLAARLHPSLRVPGMDILFPPGVIDYEDRPYHYGWLFYAWPGEGR